MTHRHCLHVPVCLCVRSGSQYFACVALQPEVNAAMQEYKVFYSCVATCIQINLYTLLIPTQCKKNIVNQALFVRFSAAPMLNHDINIRQTGSTVGSVVSYYKVKDIVWPHMVYSSALSEQ